MEPSKFEDNENTFAQLPERLEKTLAHSKTFQAPQIDGSEQRAITVNTARGPITQQEQTYILRHNGVELGKADYLGTV